MKAKNILLEQKVKMLKEELSNNSLMKSALFCAAITTNSGSRTLMEATSATYIIATANDKMKRINRNRIRLGNEIRN